MFKEQGIEKESRELINERDLFGEVEGEALVEGGYDGWIKRERFKKMDQEDEIELVKQFQPEDMTSFADELHTLVCENLGIENPDQLKFYTSVGSRLDFGRGVDGFFELDIGNGKIISVTLDGTENLYKMEYGKPDDIEGKREADVTFLWLEDIKEQNEFGWNTSLENAARMVANDLKTKVEVVPNLDDESIQGSLKTVAKSKEQSKRLEQIRQARRLHRSNRSKKKI